MTFWFAPMLGLGVVLPATSAGGCARGSQWFSIKTLILHSESRHTIHMTQKVDRRVKYVLSATNLMNMQLLWWSVHPAGIHRWRKIQYSMQIKISGTIIPVKPEPLKKKIDRKSKYLNLWAFISHSGLTKHFSAKNPLVWKPVSALSSLFFLTLAFFSGETKITSLLAETGFHTFLYH